VDGDIDVYANLPPYTLANMAPETYGVLLERTKAYHATYPALTKKAYKTIIGLLHNRLLPLSQRGIPAKPHQQLESRLQMP